MELYIETLTGTAFELRVSPFETVMSVKAKIQRMEGIPISQQHLVWQSKELEDDCCLQDYHITDGATIKLVLAMRGGPINTRRVAVEDPAWKEMVEYMEANRDEFWEKLPGGRQVTLLVFRDRDQINFFRVIDRGDGTVSPLAESLSGASIKNLNDEDQDGVLQERNTENDVTLQKMKMLRKKLDALSLKKKPKKSRIQNPSNSRSSSRNSSHVLSVKSKIHNPGFSLNKHLRLPPVNATYVSTAGKTDSLIREVELDTSNKASVGASNAETLSGKNPDDAVDQVLENKMTVQETGAVHKPQNQLCLVNNSNAASSRTYASSLSGINTYRRSLMQLRSNSTVDSSLVKEYTNTKNVASSVSPSNMSEPKHYIGLTSVTHSASGRTRIACSNPKFDSLQFNSLQETLAKLDPRITGASTDIHNSRMPLINRRDSVSFGSTGFPMMNQVDYPKNGLVHFRPKTSPEKWSKSSFESMKNQEVSQATKHLCETLNRTRMKLRSQGSVIGASQERIRRRSRSIESDNVPSLEQAKVKGNNSIVEVEKIEPQISTKLDHQHISPVEEKAVAQDLSIKNSHLPQPESSRQGQIGSTQKLPPVHIALTVTTSHGTRCKICKKKTGLATSYTCRCGGNFCATHRYAETHNCSYDYKTEGRRILQESNPMIAAPKLPKI